MKKVKVTTTYILTLLALLSLILISWIDPHASQAKTSKAANPARFLAISQTEAFSPVAYIIQLSSDNATLASDYDDIKRKNIFGICWRGEAADNLKFAKQMGYHNIQYRPGMQNLAEASGIQFMLQKPENLMTDKLGVTQVIRYATTYTTEQQNIFQGYYCLKNTTHPFPHNIATGWFTFNNSGKPTQFALVHDWQQKRVLDMAVDITVAKAKELERPERGFVFGGLAWDEPDLTGDFSSDSAAFKQGKNTPVTLAFWTGGDSSKVHPGTSHEFSTHSDAKATYYKMLKSRFKEEFPGRKLITHWEPYNLNSELLHQVLARPDKAELMEDVLWTSEGSNAASITRFADDATLFAPGKLTRDWVGSTQPNEHRFDKIKEIVGKAGIHGSWFGWFGRFDDNSIYNIYDVPNWHQLARCIPSWDNLCGVPLSQRSFLNGVYLSSNSSMSDKVLYSRQHETNKLFVVFLDPTATIPLKPGDQVLSVKRVDNFFIETTDARAELIITNDMISLAPASSKDMKAGSLSVFPNPARDYLSIRLTEDKEEYSYQITDMSGKQVKTDLIRDSEVRIPLEKLSAGSYFIRLYHSGKMVDSAKFIKE
jgi:hypothetical protein